MQNNAAGHAAEGTQEDLQERVIIVIFWPAFSPYLNQIEIRWN